jgi:hypothetical protein
MRIRNPWLLQGPAEGGDNTTVPADFRLVLRKMHKKDVTTRLKALQAVFRIRIHVFFGLPDPVWIRLWIRIRILLSSYKNNKKNLESYYFVTLFDFLSLKNNVNVPSKVTSRKNCVKKLVSILKVNDENSRIPIH